VLDSDPSQPQSFKLRYCDWAAWAIEEIVGGENVPENLQGFNVRYYYLSEEQRVAWIRFADQLPKKPVEVVAVATATEEQASDRNHYTTIWIVTAGVVIALIVAGIFWQGRKKKS
jgi:hypothetical protein